LIKTVGNFRRTRYRGVERTSFAAYLVGAAYNLLRIRQALSQRMNRVASKRFLPRVYPVTTRTTTPILTSSRIRQRQARDSTLSSTHC
jgi:hypothetical protein